MASRLVLHIGTMKSGTTFLQTALIQNTALHEAQGDFIYASGSFRAQSAAARKVLTHPDSPAKHQEWYDLLAKTRAHGASTAVVSQEFIGFADDLQTDAFLAATDGFEVEVIVTVRDQFRAIPAQWQSFVRNQGAAPWSSYLKQIDPARRREEDVDGHASRTFHRAQDVVPMLRRWGSHPRVSKLSVVTVPPSSAPRDELWHRFCAAAGLVSTLAYLGASRDNVSLGYASCDTLRRINANLEPLDPKVRRAYRTGMAPITRGVLADLRESEGRPQLDRGGLEFARRSNQEIRDEIALRELSGSLDDLPVPAELPSALKRAAEPDRREVQRAMRAVWEHFARETGRGDRMPRSLDKAAAQIMEMAPGTAAWQEGIALKAQNLDDVPLA